MLEHRGIKVKLGNLPEEPPTSDKDETIDDMLRKLEHEEELLVDSLCEDMATL